MNCTAFLSPPDAFRWVQGSPPATVSMPPAAQAIILLPAASIAISAITFLASARFDKVDSQAEI